MQLRSGKSELQPASAWPASREEGLARLIRFADDGAALYGKARNYDYGPNARANVSVLSPYIRHRLITEDEAVAAVIAQHGLSIASSYVDEVCWRAYWKGWLQMRPAVWTRYQRDVARLQDLRASDSELERRLTAVENGQSGIACFDAWVRELVETGYLHNHARMWFASIWIYTLKLPWQLGADFFLRHLLDGDPASNTLSWRWAGGLHTKGKTYLARESNIAEYTGGRFPPARGLATAAPALEELDPVEMPAELPKVASAPAGPVALFVTEDDLRPETWPLAGSEVQTVFVLDTSQCAHPRAAHRVQRFKSAALREASERASRHFWCPSLVVAAGDPAVTGTIRSRCKSGMPFVAAENPVGPVSDVVDKIFAGLKQDGVGVTRIRRPWDDAFWPLATAGFFKLREQIPAVLRKLEVIRD